VIEIGSVFTNESSGYCVALSTEGMHSSGLILTETAAVAATAVQGGAVYLEGFGQIGRVSGLTYSTRDKRLLVYFLVDDAAHLGDGSDLYGSPTLAAEYIQCFSCNRDFRKGDRACPCIKKSARVVLHEISVSGLTLSLKTQDHALLETRSRLMLAMTASVLANLVLDDE
jgi:hypothetical protein